MCLASSFISKAKRESLINVTLQQLCGLHGRDHRAESEFLVMPAVPNSFPPAPHQHCQSVTALQISHLLPVVR